MNKGTKQAIFILSLIPIMYLFGVLIHSFTTWQAPLWSPALWDEKTRGLYSIFSIGNIAYACLFYAVSKDN